MTDRSSSKLTAKSHSFAITTAVRGNDTSGDEMPRATHTKFDNAECSKLQRESLQCLTNFDNEDKPENCSAFFERYKQCLKDRRDREIAEKKARSQSERLP